jgi:hypothetical protein
MGSLSVTGRGTVFVKATKLRNIKGLVVVFLETHLREFRCIPTEEIAWNP